MIRNYRPVKFNYITQEFGENKACAKVDANGQMIRPAVISGKTNGICMIGSRPFYELMGMLGHNGRDFSCPIGTPIYHSATFDGFAKNEIDYDGGKGTDIISKEAIMECTEGCPAGTMHHVKKREWHLSEQLCYDGKPISFGDPIAKSGNTGASSGPHLHDAMKWCDVFGNGIHTGNGYYGAINDKSIFINKFVLDHIEENKKIEDQINKIQLSLIEIIRQWIFIFQKKVDKLLRKK